MPEYYKVGLLRKNSIEELGIVEEFILEIDGSNSDVLAYRSTKPDVSLVVSRVEKLTEKQAEDLASEINS